jgi:hypothetical protein
MEDKQYSARPLIYSMALVILAFVLFLATGDLLGVIISVVITLVSLFIAFKLFLPRLEDKFIKAIILTMITIFSNFALSFIGFSGALFAIVIQFKSLRYITKMDFLVTFILTIIITIINFLIISGIILLES